jgi:hypothetical protein
VADFDRRQVSTARWLVVLSTAVALLAIVLLASL